MTSIDSVKELVALDDAANVSACLNETQAIAEISYEEARTSITAVCAGEMLIGVQANSFSKCSAQLAETQTTHNPVAFESQEDLDLGELSAFQEGGVLAFEGAGTWMTWRTTNPTRVKQLYVASVLRLERTFSGVPVDPSDSDDGSATKLLRYEAHKNKVLGGFMGWETYDSYRVDFDAEEGSHPIFQTLRGNASQRCDVLPVAASIVRLHTHF